MKMFFIIMNASFFLFACSHQTEKKTQTNTSEQEVTQENLGETTIEFKKTLIDFGKIKEGEVVMHSYVFTNTGNKDLKIKRVEAACGCTASKYTTDIVKPGETGEVEVKFDSSNRSGKQSKTVTVYANTIPARNVLYFTAEIETL